MAANSKALNYPHKTRKNGKPTVVVVVVLVSIDGIRWAAWRGDKTRRRCPPGVTPTSNDKALSLGDPMRHPQRTQHVPTVVSPLAHLSLSISFACLLASIILVHRRHSAKDEHRPRGDPRAPGRTFCSFTARIRPASRSVRRRSSLRRCLLWASSCCCTLSASSVPDRRRSCS